MKAPSWSPLTSLSIFPPSGRGDLFSSLDCQLHKGGAISERVNGGTDGRADGGVDGAAGGCMSEHVQGSEALPDAVVYLVFAV